MKLHIDTENKIITIESPSKLEDFINLFSGPYWSDFTLVGIDMTKAYQPAHNSIKYIQDNLPKI